MTARHKLLSEAIAALLELSGDDRELAMATVRAVASRSVYTPPAPGVRGPKLRIWPRIAELYKAGVKAPDIAAQLGLRTRQVRDAIHNARKRGRIDAARKDTP